MVLFVLVYHCVEAVIELRVENFIERVLLKRRKFLEMNLLGGKVISFFWQEDKGK